MIIWRGWGILAVLVAAGCIGGSAALHGLLGLGASMAGLFMGLGVVATGVVCWFLGQHMNKTLPARKLETYMAARSQEIHHAVETGQFAPGGIRPTSLEDARAQGAAVLQAEQQALAGRLNNVHTLFFIPMQYVGVIVGIIGLVVTFLGVISAVRG